MKFFYGLALALILFDGFISQCEGAGGSEEASTSINLKKLPNNVYEEILFRTGFSATEQAAKDNQRSLTAVKKIFEDRIIQVRPMNWDHQISEESLNGSIYLNINDVNRALSFFKNFGDHIKKIKINYEFVDDIDRRQINENIITKYAKQFTDFHIVTFDSFSTFLDQLSNGGERTHFLNVKRLRYEGPSFGESYDLNAIFPNLESLTLYYNPFFMDHTFMQINTNCMTNIKKLEELKLEINPVSYELHDLEHIFVKNKQLFTLGLVLIDKIDILRSIEVHANTVQTLEIHIDGTDFLTHVSEKQPFNMPKLKRLNLRGSCDDSRIISFINSFKKLETLEVMVSNALIISQIEQLIEINEFITYYPSITNLKDTLESFGRKKKLNMIKFSQVDQNTCDTFKSQVSQINKKLKQSQNLTWKVNCSNDTITLLRSK
ncbi:uncharacterized protein LOC116347408 [Contarinia nasturtii]|uniref:uncharacterized protein LOC116347408 n=1 Tax=Contarinia nasturtii TaxID=265458 RepID=UPI0012D40B70|nr:uncharacterized protein LOC116347408 [Contarinia nasturtii]